MEWILESSILQHGDTSLSLSDQNYKRYQREYKASYIPSELINASRGNIRLIFPLRDASISWPGKLDLHVEDDFSPFQLLHNGWYLLH